MNALSAEHAGVVEAKAALLAFGERADAAAQLEVNRARAAGHRLVPWAAGGAGVLGLVVGKLGLFRGRRRGKGAAREEPSVSSGGWLALAISFIAIARRVIPIVNTLLGWSRR